MTSKNKKPKSVYDTVKKPRKPKLPEGYRFLKGEEIDAVRHLSSYEYVYPQILEQAIMWKEDHWKAGPFRFFWDHTYYCVPK